MILSDRVGERMRHLGLTQSELARRVGVTQPTIYKILNTNKKGSAHLHKVARELETTSAYLEGETDDPAADAPPAPELNSSERDLLACYRALDDATRGALIQVARSMARNAGGRNHSGADL